MQFVHGQHLVLRYDRPAPESTPAMLVPSIERIAWEDPGPLDPKVPSFVSMHLPQIRLAINGWPPLWNPARVLIGGEIAVPDRSAGAIEYREFGFRLSVRAMTIWPLAATLIAAAAWLALRARRAANRPGHCRACGYDRRATPDRCPECGADAPAAAPAP